MTRRASGSGGLTVRPSSRPLRPSSVVPPPCPQQDLVELSSDPLLPLILVEGDTFSALCTALASSQPDPSVAGRIAQALTRLMPAGVTLPPLQGGGASPEPSRQTKRLFREGLYGIVSEVRSLIRTR